MTTGDSRRHAKHDGARVEQHRSEPTLRSGLGVQLKQGGDDDEATPAEPSTYDGEAVAEALRQSRALMEKGKGLRDRSAVVVEQARERCARHKQGQRETADAPDSN